MRRVAFGLVPLVALALPTFALSRLATLTWPSILFAFAFGILVWLPLLISAVEVELRIMRHR